MTFLAASDLNKDEFLSVLKKTRWPDNALLMAFSPAEFRFEQYAFAEGFPEGSDQGRIFSPKGELRWRRLSEKLRVVYLGDTPPPSQLQDCSSELEKLTRETGHFILWGKRTDLEQEWLEQQVPHRFDYPLTTREFSRGRIKLLVEKWVDEGGLSRFSRYCGLEEMKGED